MTEPEKSERVKQFAKKCVTVSRLWILVFIFVLFVAYIGMSQRKIGKLEAERNSEKIVIEFQNAKDKIRDKWDARRCYNLQSCREFLHKYMDQSPASIPSPGINIPRLETVHREDVLRKTGDRHVRTRHEIPDESGIE